MSANWRKHITLIKNVTDSVDAIVTNKPLQELAERTEYLKERLDNDARGEGVVVYAAPIDSAVNVGDAVYWNFSKELYKQAIASAVDSDTGQLRTADSAYARGIVIRKLSTSTADILVNGFFRNLTINDESNSPLTAGHYYLSSTHAGKLTKSRPAVGIYVCAVMGTDVFVSPTPREVLEEHIHYKFDLATNPAGDTACVGDTVTISNADNTRLGWLPANDSIFQSLAPRGAVFGYNWTKDATLAAVWPPQPVGSAYVELNGVGVSPELMLVDENGIWWLSSCIDHTPWRTSCGSSSALPYDSSSVANCPDIARTMTIWFTKMVAKTSQAAVTGIRPATDSPIVVTGCTDPDVSGYCASRVTLDLDLNWTNAENNEGDAVVKSVTGNSALQRGYVVEGIKGDGLIEVTGTRSLTSGYKAGRVTVTGVDPTAVTRKISPEVVALDGATESLYAYALPYIGLPKGRNTSFTVKFRIPDISIPNPVLDIVLWVATPGAGTPPANTYIANMIIDSADGLSSSSGGDRILPTSWSSNENLSLETLGAKDAGAYFSVLASTISVDSNQIVLAKIGRSASDSYAGELAIVNIYGTIRAS